MLPSPATVGQGLREGERGEGGGGKEGGPPPGSLSPTHRCQEGTRHTLSLTQSATSCGIGAVINSIFQSMK